MPINGADIYDIRRGMIAAPAGCGKTQLILSALQVHEKQKPVLVLTHTNAGVAAIKSRMQRLGISPKCCKVVTIDGFCMRLVGTFPQRSNINPQVLLLNNPSNDYALVRSAALSLMQGHHVDDILAASYSNLIVDEYQDCNLMQHELVVELARLFPTCLLGDPLQAIFAFSGTPVDWVGRVCRDFPVVEELSTPWRWINAGARDLGEWILSCRPALLSGASIDIRSAPAAASWIELGNDAAENIRRRQAAASVLGATDDNVLIIGDSRNVIGRQQFASTIVGASTVEAVDLRDLINFGRIFDPTAENALLQLLEFSHTLIAGVSVQNIIDRVRVLRSGTERVAANVVENAAIVFLTTPNMRTAAGLLRSFASLESCRVYRPHIYHLALKAMDITILNQRGLIDACLQVREQNRAQGRMLPHRAVGSTLLLKGLEAEIVVILNAEELDSRNLYVAMSRGSKQVIFCSTSPFLNA